MGGKWKAVKQGKDNNMKMIKTDSSTAVPSSQLSSQDSSDESFSVLPCYSRLVIIEVTVIVQPAI